MKELGDWDRDLLDVARADGHCASKPIKAKCCARTDHCHMRMCAQIIRHVARHVSPLVNLFSLPSPQTSTLFAGERGLRSNVRINYFFRVRLNMLTCLEQLLIPAFSSDTHLASGLEVLPTARLTSRLSFAHCSCCCRQAAEVRGYI